MRETTPRMEEAPCFDEDRPMTAVEEISLWFWSKYEAEFDTNLTLEQVRVAAETKAYAVLMENPDIWQNDSELEPAELAKFIADDILYETWPPKIWAYHDRGAI